MRLFEKIKLINDVFEAKELHSNTYKEACMDVLNKYEQQLTITDVSQQRELFNSILDFSEDLPMCTEDYHRSELWEKYKALNCG